MSGAEEEHETEGIPWERELEDDSLAEAQARLETEFGAEFEESDHELKGFARENSMPFYTGVSDTIDFKGEEVELTVEREGGLNKVEFWTDNHEVMETMDNFFEDYEASHGGEVSVEPYKFNNVKDVELLDFLVDVTHYFEVEGPYRRPGNGQPRIHPVRRPNISETDDNTIIIGDEHASDGYNDDQESGEPLEDDIVTYQGDELFVPGDAELHVVGLREEDESKPDYISELDDIGKISIRPEKRSKDSYRVSVKSEDPDSLNYLIERSRDTLE